METRRLIDISVSSLGLAVAALPILFSVAAVAATMGGHPIFKQQRYGLNGKPFTIYKIRTMTDARDFSGRLLPDQMRQTPVGSLLRKTGIDELPQFLNILKGDMSIFGPRPHMYKHPVHGWEQRHKILPGLIGLAKIREKKAGIQNAPIQELQDDLEYIKTRNAALDARLLFKAAKLAVTGRIDPQPARSSALPSGPVSSLHS